MEVIANVLMTLVVNFKVKISEKLSLNFSLPQTMTFSGRLFLNSNIEIEIWNPDLGKKDRNFKALEPWSNFNESTFKQRVRRNLDCSKSFSESYGNLRKKIPAKSRSEMLLSFRWCLHYYVNVTVKFFSCSIF